ncbi:MAG: biosynthetic-type acetolactate synthase large subunit [Synergistales bacterium]|nr:biosynthetic-type acetolactate synthase large subunit [Synergistales bacterium]
MKMSGAQMVVAALEAEEVQHVFGIPGGAVIPLYDAIADGSFTHVLTRHEQAACHAADAYARTTGRTGVCIATSGPGATNVLTGIANANIDSVPLVVIAGQVTTANIGTDGFQEADVYGCSMPIVKHSFLVRDIAGLPEALRGAFLIANSGRPGVVMLELPVDVQQQVAEFVYPPDLSFPGYDPQSRLDLSEIDAAVSRIARARQPVILAGGGCILAGAEAELRRMAEGLQIPVANTLMGKGAFPDNHPLALGMLGMHGTPTANLAVSDADLLIAAGTRFSDRTTGAKHAFAPGAAVIHIDLDPAELDKIIHADITLTGDAREILAELNARTEAVPQRSAWLGRLNGWANRYPLSHQSTGDTLSPQEVITRVRAKTGDEGVVSTEVGQHQMWAALYWECRRSRTFLTSGGLGTMGYGLPAAIGGAFGAPGRPVTCLAGDGSILMNIQELETISRYRLPIKIIVLHNSSLGMVRQWQQLFWKRRYSETCPTATCRLAAVAQAFGIPGVTVSDPEHFGKALDEAYAAEGPFFLECLIPQEDNVMPMVPPGKGLRDFLYDGNTTAP